MAAAIRIVGCGRWSMGDDRVGLLVAGQLSECHIPDTEVSLEESPTCLADPGDGVELLVIVDAAQADERHPPGSTLFLDYRNSATVPGKSAEAQETPANMRAKPSPHSSFRVEPSPLSGRGLGEGAVNNARSFSRTLTHPAPPTRGDATVAAAAAIDGHSLGVLVGLELAEALGTLPPEVWIYVLFGTDYQRGFSVSPPVADGIQALARRIEADVRRWIGARSCTS